MADIFFGWIFLSNLMNEKRVGVLDKTLCFGIRKKKEKGEWKRGTILLGCKLHS